MTAPIFACKGNAVASVEIGDCRDVMATWPAGFADAVIADPPYADTSLAWDKTVEGWFDEAARVLKPSGSLWVFGILRTMPLVFAEAARLRFTYSQDIVWEKQNGTGFHNDRFRRVHEHAVMFYRGAWKDCYHQPQYTNDARAKVVRRKTRPTHTGHIDAGHYVSEDGGPRLQRSVMQVRNEHGRAVHPTQKPEGIIEPLMLYSVPPGGTCAVPFTGSAAVEMVALKHGRNVRGCELDPTYAPVIFERLAAVQQLTPP